MKRVARRKSSTSPSPQLALVRRRPLSKLTVASLREMADSAASGELSAVISIGVRPGYSCWIVRSRMTSRDRANVIYQIEYLKHMLLNDEESE